MSALPFDELPRVHFLQHLLQLSRRWKALKALAHFAGYLMHTDGHGVFIRRNPWNQNGGYDGNAREGHLFNCGLPLPFRSFQIARAGPCVL